MHHLLSRLPSRLSSRITRRRDRRTAVAALGTALVIAGAVSGCSSASGSAGIASPSASSSAAASTETAADPSASSGQTGQPTATVDGVKVDGDLGAEPTVTIDSDVEPPTQLVVKELAPGTGPEVQAGDTVTAHYVGVAWGTGQVFDSSWSGQPATFPLAQVIPGWQQGLVGQKVGGRTLLIIPPDLGYGAQEIPGIPANSTLVFVVDLTAVNGQS